MSPFFILLLIFLRSSNFLKTVTEKLPISNEPNYKKGRKYSESSSSFDTDSSGYLDINFDEYSNKNFENTEYNSNSLINGNKQTINSRTDDLKLEYNDSLRIHLNKNNCISRKCTGEILHMNNSNSFDKLKPPSKIDSKPSVSDIKSTKNSKIPNYQLSTISSRLKANDTKKRNIDIKEYKSMQYKKKKDPVNLNNKISTNSHNIKNPDKSKTEPTNRLDINSENKYPKIEEECMSINIKALIEKIIAKSFRDNFEKFKILNKKDSLIAENKSNTKNTDNLDDHQNDIKNRE